MGRYTPRVALSHNRLRDIGEGQVRFRWKDYRDHHQRKTMTLTAEEFIRRFPIHVPPPRFQRLRYYGLLGNRYREEKLARCRQRLGMPPAAIAAASPQDYRDRYQQLTGGSLRECPVCHQGRLRVVGTLPAGHAPAIIDTS